MITVNKFILTNHSDLIFGQCFKHQMSSESQISNIDISEGEQIHRKQSSEGQGQIEKLPRDQSLGIEGRQVFIRMCTFLASGNYGKQFTKCDTRLCGNIVFCLPFQ